VLEKFGVEDLAAQQRAELVEVRRQLRTLRGFKASLGLTKEASEEIGRLEDREQALTDALAHSARAVRPSQE
jgi:hypothetical protein